MARQRILFCRIDWAKKYDGSKEDIEKYGVSRDEINCKIGHEMFNFKNFDGTYYGFVELQNNKDHKIGIENLGTTPQDESISDVLVVWVSTNPQVGGMYIVGWYEDAIVYRRIQTLTDAICTFKRERLEEYGIELSEDDLTWLTQYRIKTKSAVLIPCENRNQQVEGFGQANIWYADKDQDRETVEKVIAYIEKYSASN